MNFFYNYLINLQNFDGQHFVSSNLLLCIIELKKRIVSGAMINFISIKC